MSEKYLERIQSGDDGAFELLLAQYRPLIENEVKVAVSRSPELMPEYEELTQEARLALYGAAKNYRSGGKVTFGLYAKICIHNRIVSFVRKFRTLQRKNARLAKAGSHAASVGRKRRGHSVFDMTAVSETGKLSVSDKESGVPFSADKALKFLETDATVYEKQVFLMYIQGLSYREIAARLGKSQKSVDNAIFRVKRKLKDRFGSR